MFLLNDWDWVGISGNHEAMLLDWLNGKNQNDIMVKYGSGISTAAEQLSHKTASYLYEMPSFKKLNINNKKVILCHGSPWDRDVYIYPDSSQNIVDKMFEYDSDFDVLVYGHSHYPIIWEKDNKKIINPGSVGQPRDKSPGASWVLWDSNTNNANFYREKYDANPVIEMCRKYDPDIKYLADVLVRQ